MGAQPGTVRTSTASTIAAIKRHHGPEDPRLPELLRELRAAALSEHIQKAVAEKPPFTEDQLRGLAADLFGGGR